MNNVFIHHWHDYAELAAELYLATGGGNLDWQHTGA